MKQLYMIFRFKINVKINVYVFTSENKLEHFQLKKNNNIFM